MTYYEHLRRKLRREGVHLNLNSYDHTGARESALRKRIVNACDGDRPRSVTRRLTVTQTLKVQPW